MTLDVSIAETRRFQLDCALYSLSSEKKEILFARLKADPIIGRPRADTPSVWLWEFAGLEISYAMSEDFSSLVLLAARPPAPRPARLWERTWDVIDKINKLKRLVGL